MHKNKRNSILVEMRYATITVMNVKHIIPPVKNRIMTRNQKLETIVKILAKNMYYGDWKWETPNERVITMLMQELELYPFSDEMDMMFRTQVDESLYKKSIENVKLNLSNSHNTGKQKT